MGSFNVVPSPSIALDEFSHVDFYYKPEAVKVAADAVAEFFKKA